MSSRMKEEERIERIIRGLLKQPDNKRCINCNTLGPQYVCTTFWTFVCTNCSGIHREFTHRVKSVSMAKFTADEVNSLQAGGNERARQIYFKTWDPNRNFCPDGSNLNKLRDFIKNVYVDRKFSGDRIQDNNKLSMVKLGTKDVYDERRSSERSTPTAREAFYERHSLESSSFGDRRSSSRGGREDVHDRNSLEKYIATRKNEERNLRYCLDQIRSPRGSIQDQIRSPRQQKNRPARFEIVDDRFREDGSGNVKRYEHYRFSKAQPKHGSGSPDSRRGRDELSPRVVRPVRDILGDKVVELKVGESPKSKEGKGTESSANAKKSGGSAESSGSANAKPNQNKVIKTISLIDFDADPQPIAASTSSSNEMKAAPTVDSLESLLFALSPAVAPAEVKPLAPAVDDATSANLEITAPPEAQEILALPGPEHSEFKVQNEQQHLHSVFSSGINIVTPQQSTALVLYNEDSALEPSPNFGDRIASASTPPQDASTGNDSYLSGRKELPADLFTSSYAQFPGASSGWQFHSPYGMGYGMQYHPNARMMVSTKSRNPFDFGDESPQDSAPMFPSMLKLQVEPNISPLLPIQPQPLPYAFASPQLATSYGMAPMPSGAYVGQQLTNNMLITGNQERNGSETDDSSFASLNPLNQSSGGFTYQMPSTSHPSSSRGNPFS